MAAQTSRWFEYGEPVDGDRVEATIRTAYETGPNESREDDVRRGTIPIEALDVLDDPDVQRHVHEDGALLLSAVDDEIVEEMLLEDFGEDGLSRVQEVIERGASAAEAVDYLMTEERGLSQSIWAERRRISQQAVSKNVDGAREALGER